jgi:raffinose/stachyose/melibiose transport system substrate-binding protein
MAVHKHGRWALLAALTAGAMALTACSSSSGGGETTADTATGGAETTATDTTATDAPALDGVEITFLVDNNPPESNVAYPLVDAFNALGNGVTVKIETRPQGTEGDNLVKTNLATGSMPDVFAYNSGSLFQALDPAKNLVPLTGEAFMDNVQESFLPTVTNGSDVYGVPIGSLMGGGILYNKKVYADLGLEVPLTWADFMANNAKIKEAGIDPVIQTYGDTWTSQLFILADFYNVSAADPEWAAQYTANNRKYVDEPAFKGFQRLEDVAKAGYLNKDYASALLADGLQQLVDGTGAHFPMLTFTVSAYSELSADAAQNIGFFAQPGDDAAKNGLTAWAPSGIYIPTTTTGDKLAAAKQFLAFAASVEAVDAINAKITPSGPFLIKGSTLPDGLPAAVMDLQAYVDNGNNAPALEFLSPIKGPNLESITVEVGSGISSAADGAKRYDEDVVKQAQQLGLPGW